MSEHFEIKTGNIPDLSFFHKLRMSKIEEGQKALKVLEENAKNGTRQLDLSGNSQYLTNENKIIQRTTSLHNLKDPRLESTERMILYEGLKVNTNITRVNLNREEKRGKE